MDLTPEVTGATQPVVRMAASGARRVVGTAAVALLGAMVADVGISGAYGVPERVLILATAALAMAMAVWLWRSGTVVLEYRGGVLRETGPDGRVLAEIENIHRVDRGAFAFKPSNGFLLSLNAAATIAWVPGLWWRRGRKVGVGGLVPANQAKLVAEMIALDIARRG